MFENINVTNSYSQIKKLSDKSKWELVKKILDYYKRVIFCSPNLSDKLRW